MSSSTAEHLFAGFSPASDADWRRAAEESLEGAPFEKKLVTRTAEGIDLQPIYSRTDGEKLGPDSLWPGLPPYVRDARPLGSRAGGWLVCQDLGALPPDEFNAALRDALGRGQNAVVLPLDSATRRGSDPAIAQPSEVGDIGLSLSTLEDADRALRGVELGAVPVFASAGIAALEVTALLSAWMKRQGKTGAALHGGVLGDPLGEWLRAGRLPMDLGLALDDLGTLTSWVQREGWNLRTIGVDAAAWSDAGAHAVQELAFGLATGVAYVRAMQERGLEVGVSAPRVLFTFGLGSNLFLEVAKLRAARLVWARAMQVAGGGPEAQRLECHGRTTRWNKTVLDPHVNLLRTTTEAFAGVIGGCAGLQVGAFDDCYRTSDDFSRRLARNIQIILAEECQLGRVVDPAGGSWYVETLTRQLAAKAWGLFQDIEGRGGMFAAVKAGYPQALVEKTAADRIAAVEGRRDGVIGTNLHPNLRERIPPAGGRTTAPRPSALGRTDAVERSAFAHLATCGRESLPEALQEAFRDGVTLGAAVLAVDRERSPSPEVKPLVARRRAEPFEALRRRSEAWLQRTGGRPKVFLAGVGPRKQHAARHDFSQAFFAAGGFEPVAGRGLDTAETAAKAALESGAPIVVLCSTDDTYPALVPVFAAALKAAPKPPVVVLAGLPASPELQQQFKAAGIDEFIHLRANCAKLLSTFQDQLGL
ncbi:MAG: acyl-CoA mutase large subunit family protein [Verrucomicrobia bacterium]|nr:acyl-CoA mutase large subunit family protein [Verrucomicrobiota bacterium]